MGMAAPGGGTLLQIASRLYWVLSMPFSTLGSWSAQ